MGYDEEEKDKWLRRRVTVNRKEVIFEYIMAQNVPKLTKDIKSQKQKTRTLASEQIFQNCEEKGFPTLFVTIDS